MKNIDLKDPIFDISKEAHELFSDLKQREEFKGFDNKDFFLISLLFGYAYGKRKPLADDAKIQWTRERYFAEEDMHLLRALVIAEDGEIKDIDNIAKIISCAEAYSNAGVIELKKFIYDNPADYILKFGSYLRSLNDSKHGSEID